MNRVLLITYGFPPVNRVNSQGAAKQARGLAELGWEVHVLTVADPPTYLFDPELARWMPENVVVHEAYSLEPTRVLQLIRRLRGRDKARPVAEKPGTKQAPRNYTALPQWAVELFRSAFFPDEKIGWSPFAVRMAKRLHRELHFDAVISTGPPYTDHVVGLRVARKLKIPWLCVLMDPIVDNVVFTPLTPLHNRYFHRLEQAVAREASAIAIATRPWMEELIGRAAEAAGKTFVFPNSFDPTAFSGPPPSAHTGFLVSYVGTFQLTVHPKDLLDAVVALRQDPDIASNLRIRFVGPLDPETTEAISSRGLDDVVERTGVVTHAEAVREMRTADVLVLILGPNRVSTGILTGKLPEYLAARRRILAIAPEGVATSTIRRARAGESALPGDVAGIEALLRRYYVEWRDGEVPESDSEVVSEFDRAHNAVRVDRVLQMLREGGRPDLENL